MKPITEKRREVIRANFKKYMERMSEWDTPGRTPLGTRAALLQEDPFEMLKLVRFLLHRQNEISHLMRWARLNKQVVSEMSPEDMKICQDHFRVTEVMGE